MSEAQIRGINHITLAVPDVDSATAFYRDVLGCEVVASWPTGAYLLAGGAWLALVEGHEPATQSTEYSHIAFDVAPEHFATLAARIAESGARLWQDNWTEGDSLYFDGPGEHRLEIHSSDLGARLRAALADPWDGLTLLRPDLAVESRSVE
jgi:catechol 2,3-dioxygenase-like lactoylglutathione lyase family enzyme